MLDISTEFKNEIFNDNRRFLPFVDITLKDGTVLNLDRTDVWENTFKVEDSTSTPSKFTIGAAVTGKFSVTLNNIYDKFSEYDFADASVVAYVGLQLSNTLENVRVGTYTIDEPSYDGSTISISCLDNMEKFDRPYSESSLQYPASASEILSDACACCGVTLITANFPNKGYVVQDRPKDDALTFGDIVAMVAQIAGCWAKMDSYGRLKLGWYDMSVFEQNHNLDGGTFGTTTTPYSDGDSADGGNFTDYSSGDSADGGAFADQKAFHHIYSTKSFSVSTDDVVITGVKVTEEFEETETEKKGTYLAGNDGYVIEVSGNSLIQKGQAQELATYLYGRVGGMRFRPFSVSVLGNPSIESGDVAYVTDRKQNTYQSFVSNRTFALGGAETVSCDAETPSRNNTARFSEMTKAIVKVRNETKKQLSTYDLAVQQLTNLMTQSFGVFKSEEVLEDGSVIYYMHNKPERSDSSTIWKMTADAFAVSTDGGKTWNAGLDSSGNAVVNVLNAIGINADWINVGTVKKELIDGEYTKEIGSMITTSESKILMTVSDTAEYLQGQIDNDVNNLKYNYPTKVAMNSAIEQTANGITQTVSKTYSTKTEAQGYAYNAERNANNATDEKLDNYSTTVEMNSAIEQTASSINLEVSKKVGSSEVISKINQTAESILISANKIDVDGVLDVDKLNALDIKAGSVDAEDITGKTFTGKVFEGGEVIGSILKNSAGTWSIDVNGNMTGGSINIGGGAFTVNSSGVVTGSSVNFTGGKIGGMIIYQSDVSGSYYLETDPDYGLTTGIGNDGKWCFWSGWNGTDAALWITQEGKIHMRDWLYGTNDDTWATWTKTNKSHRYGINYIYGDWWDGKMYIRIVFDDHTKPDGSTGYCTIGPLDWTDGEPTIG